MVKKFYSFHFATCPAQSIFNKRPLPEGIDKLLHLALAGQRLRHRQSTHKHTDTHTHNFHLKYYQTSVDDFIVRHKTLSQISPSGFSFKFPIQRVTEGDNDKQRRLRDALRRAPVLINKSVGQQRNHRQRGVIKMRIASIDILIMPFINACEVHNLVEGPDYVTRFSTWLEKLRSRQWDTLTYTCTRGV